MLALSVQHLMSVKSVEVLTVLPISSMGPNAASCAHQINLENYKILPVLLVLMVVEHALGLLFLSATAAKPIKILAITI